MDQDEMPGYPSEADAAPAPAQQDADAPSPEPAEITPLEAGAVPARVSRWPFVVYGVAWLGLTAVAAWQLTRDPSLPAYQHELYPAIVLAGIAMVALGPALGIGAWTGAWMGAPKAERAGLFTSAFLWAALWTFTGAALWWGMLVAVDAVRIGGL